MSLPVRIVREIEDEAPVPNWEALFKSVQKGLGKPLKPITVVFISTEKSKELNKRYRGKDSETNILSFEQTREILLTPAVVRQEAEDHNVSEVDWMTRLIVHGILHLEGYTHEEDIESAQMEKIEEDILSMLEISLR